jgi:nucleolar protein 58
MLVLFESPGGYALFKVLDDGKLKKNSDIYEEFADVDSASRLVTLKAYHKFQNTTDALSATTALMESKLHKSLRRFLRSEVSKDASCSKEKLALSDAKLGGQIREKLQIKCVADAQVNQLLRGIRSQLDGLLGDEVSSNDMNAMRLGLAHSLSRYRLKFSPDKVDTMIVQAIALLDELDKELNNYSMRAREWYGWHFPELSKIIPDNQMFARAVKTLGDRKNAKTAPLDDVLPEDLVEELHAAALVSMGTDISAEDTSNILALCDQIIDLSEYREQLFDYLRNRMQAIAPNLTHLVGELVGARLIAHAGSLMNLAKHPASTVQILGAEKALFRALKTKHNTPKYGLIYHASLVGQSSAKHKGRISRMLAAKAALSIRVDALGDEDSPRIAIDDRARVEARIRQIEGRGQYQLAGTPRAAETTGKYDHTRTLGGAQSRSSASYNAATDSTFDVAPASDDDSDSDAKSSKSKSSPKKSSKSSSKKKSKKRSRGDDGDADDKKSSKKKRSKKRSRSDSTTGDDEKHRSKKRRSKK